jgi:hypothetical protein
MVSVYDNLTQSKSRRSTGKELGERKNMSNETNTEGAIEMSNIDTSTTDNDLNVEEWLQIRKDAALKIDAETAEIFWTYRLTMDPYGVLPELPEKYRQIGREYFARSPESDIWVSFYDLPDDTCNRLWEIDKHKLCPECGRTLGMYAKVK